MLPKDATEEQVKEMNRQVRDIINYLTKYDDPKFTEQLGTIRNPEAVIVVIQSEQKYERGTATNVHIVAVGKFDPKSIAISLRDFLVESEETALLGRRIR